MLSSAVFRLIPFLVLSLALGITYSAAQQDEADYDVEVQKSVDNETPNAPGQTIQFAIRVTNVGDTIAQNVIIRDKLPPGLAIPEGMVAWSSRGSYDSSTGNWNVGNIAVNDSEQLNVPAVVTVEPQPACIVNEAELTVSDQNNRQNRSQVAIRGPGVERCADLEVIRNFGVSESFCGGESRVHFDMSVWNRGPQEARNVTLTMRELSSFRLPGLQFESAACTGTRCYWESIPPYSLAGAYARSRSFGNNRPQQHRIVFEVSTSDEDYVVDNNSRTISRQIPSFSPACATYGIPDGVVPGGGGAGGCFIATASYGSPMHEHVQALQGFRDRWLLTNGPGRAFVRAYYRYSGPAADYIAESTTRRQVARILLWPVVTLVVHPLVSLAALLAVAAALLLSLRARKRGLAPGSQTQ